MLNSTQNQALKAKAHHLKAIVQLGKNGASPSVVEEIRNALSAHELIKVQLVDIPNVTTHDLAATLCTECDAQLVELRGKVATLFKKFPIHLGKKSMLNDL